MTTIAPTSVQQGLGRNSSSAGTADDAIKGKSIAKQTLLFSIDASAVADVLGDVVAKKIFTLNTDQFAFVRALSDMLSASGKASIEQGGAIGRAQILEHVASVFDVKLLTQDSPAAAGVEQRRAFALSEVGKAMTVTAVSSIDRAGDLMKAVHDFSVGKLDNKQFSNAVNAFKNEGANDASALLMSQIVSQLSKLDTLAAPELQDALNKLGWALGVEVPKLAASGAGAPGAEPTDDKVVSNSKASEKVDKPTSDAVNTSVKSSTADKAGSDSKASEKSDKPKSETVGASEKSTAKDDSDAPNVTATLKTVTWTVGDTSTQVFIPKSLVNKELISLIDLATIGKANFTYDITAKGALLNFGNEHTQHINQALGAKLRSNAVTHERGKSELAATLDEVNQILSKPLATSGADSSASSLSTATSSGPASSKASGDSAAYAQISGLLSQLQSMVNQYKLV